SVYAGCTFRRPDAVWHHPLGRKKYKHFLEQPTSLTGAGRSEADNSTPVIPESQPLTNMTVLESLIPEEYHIVKNKGLRGLELYEDAFTVQLQDDEQKLRVFPSMKPSGRQEVLQLMRVMDDMLEKAGVQPQEELNQLSQIEGLLDLVRTEQNIYNVVFHELIRQVSVGCAERGQLLAKLRQRYQSLLERIPRYLKALHTEAVAQRALDRQLTVEIHRIKTSIQQLSRELARIKDHDAFVSQQAERAQHELAQALGQSQNNAEVVQRYHELYELQRSRLNSQMHQMAEERDLWSQFTYCLALKMVKPFESSPRCLSVTQAVTSGCCLVQDIEDLQCFSDIVVLWREELQRFMSGLKKRDQAQSQHLCPIQQALSKWQAFCKTQHFLFLSFCTLRHFFTSQVLGGLRECFQGEEVLAHKEALESLVTVRDKWVDLGLQLLRRHSSPENAPSQHYQNLTELQILFSELNELLNDHITGENGQVYVGPCLVRQREPSVHVSPVLQLIASDRSIIEKELGESRVQLTGSEEQAVAPVTEDAQTAFTELNTVTLLQQQLQLQVQSAQQRALKAEEALQAALQKIQDLERQVQGRSTSEPKTPEASASAPAAKTAPVKKAPPDSKPSTSSRKTRKR
uniref:Axonemal dynein light chain domain containing 1 n=1 Tax=Neogobius melanostomus TaxID=47308 RepID=A0A8C6SMB3_9GOBI